MIELDYNAVGKTIHRLRVERGLSQEVLSGFTGIARSHLSMIETGDKHPNLETIWKIANALELEPHKLIEMIEIESGKNDSR